MEQKAEGGAITAAKFNVEGLRQGAESRGLGRVEEGETGVQCSWISPLTIRASRLRLPDADFADGALAFRQIEQQIQSWIADLMRTVKSRSSLTAAARVFMLDGRLGLRSLWASRLACGNSGRFHLISWFAVPLSRQF